MQVMSLAGIVVSGAPSPFPVRVLGQDEVREFDVEVGDRVPGGPEADLVSEIFAAGGLAPEGPPRAGRGPAPGDVAGHADRERAVFGEEEIRRAGMGVEQGLSSPRQWRSAPSA